MTSVNLQGNTSNNFPPPLPDEMYNFFYHDDEYPVTRFLRQPLYFEVGLLQSSDQRLELILENCWATGNEDRTSTPSWDIIFNG